MRPLAKQALSVAGFNLLLSGCVPVASNYYDINGVGDKRIFTGCAMKMEAEMKTQLTDGIGLIYWGSANHESAGRAISINFTIAGSEVIQLTKPTVEITTGGSMIPLEIGIETVPGNPKIFVQIPPVKVDDRVIDVPPVRFVHKESVHAVGAFTGA
jgi:hypothetical protein